MYFMPQLLASLLVRLECQLLPHEVEVLSAGPPGQLIVYVNKLILELHFKCL